MNILYGIIVALLGVLWYGNNKRKQAEALNDNEETLKQVHNLDNKTDKNNLKLEQEESFRKQKEQEMTDAKKDDNMANVIDFLNRLSKK
jgi:hypothetical protein